MVSPRSSRKTSQAPALDISEAPTKETFPAYDDPEPAVIPEATGDMLDSLDNEALREAMLERGFELHRKRSRKGGIPKADSVRGKLRLTAYLPRQMRIDLSHAAIEADKNLSQITEEAISDWLEKQKLRRPGT